MNWKMIFRNQRISIPFFMAFFAVNILFASCGNPNSANSNKNLQQEPMSAPKEIGINIFAFRNLQIKGEFDSQKALLQLFPGNSLTLQMGSQSVDAVNWSCANCRPLRFEGMSSPDDEIFPAREGMTTRFRDALYFKANGKEQVLMSVSSGYYTENQALIGRMSCGFLGLALFEKSADTWNLISFNPAVGCFGSFATAPAPKLVQVGKNQAFALDNYVGGGRLPETCDRTLVGRVNNKFQILHRTDFFERKNAQTSAWKSEITSENNHAIFSDLQIITKGKISKSDLDEWDIEYLSEALQNQLEKDSVFSFELSQRLHFGKNGYEIKDEKLKIIK